jgi:phosphopantothenoylcysteine decarboxylase/phosphopantothenate--cysteine ligase
MTEHHDPAVPTSGRPRVVLGVSGGIAAYKACELLRRFTESGHDVTVVPTAAALEFVGAPTWSALSGKPVASAVWTDVHQVPHVRIGQTGRSGRRRSRPPPTCSPRPRTDWPTTCSPTSCSRRAARWCSRPRCTPRCGSTRRPRPTWPPCANVGVIVIEPAEGRLTGKDTGGAAFPSPPRSSISPSQVLARRADQSTIWRVVTSSSRPGAPANTSTLSGSWATVQSGLQGYALARTAVARGAEVTLVAANVTLPTPRGSRSSGSRRPPNCDEVRRRPRRPTAS